MTTKMMYEVYTSCGACVSHLLFISGAQCRHYHLNDGSTVWIVTVPYESEEALRERLTPFDMDYDDIISLDVEFI